MKNQKNEIKFFQCRHCGKIIAIIKDSGTPTVCCDDEMQEMKAGTADTSQEKHIPVIKKDSCRAAVSVGSIPHPMEEEHYIEWILLHTSMGFQKKLLKPGDEPNAEFKLYSDEIVINAYEYCSIHKLWKGN